MPRTPDLTPKQERFCRLLLEGATQEHAYVTAGYSSQGRTAAENACRLAKNDKIKRRLAELQASVAKKVEKTVADVIFDLDRLRDEAFATGQLAAGVQAVMGAARILGMITDKAQLEVIHKPAPLPTSVLELDADEWVAQFSGPREAITGPKNANGRNSGRRP